MGVFSTPRPLPDRRWPALAGTLVIVLGLPVFLAAGWGFAPWALAASLWAVGEAVSYTHLTLPTILRV